MRDYTQLIQEERYQIESLLKMRHHQSEIAVVLKRDKSTISREVRRKPSLRGYRPKQAQRLALARHEARAKPRIDPGTWEWVESLLREDWSPEQISGWLLREQGLRASHEWIYQRVYADKHRGGSLHAHLRCQKKRRKRYGSNERRGQIRGRVSIDERPEIIEERSRTGDWEADTVIGKPGGPVLLTLAERRTRYSVIAKAPDKSAQAVTDALLAALQPHADLVHTLTYDNGKEFAYHQTVAERLDAQGYFARPYHSWERGLNENTNGLIRQYLPKGTDFRLSHLRRSAASWTGSTTSHGNVLASRLQISYSQESTHLLQQEFPHLKKRYWGQHIWARGYFCTTVGQVTDQMIRDYIEGHVGKSPDDSFTVDED